MVKYFIKTKGEKETLQSSGPGDVFLRQQCHVKVNHKLYIPDCLCQLPAFEVTCLHKENTDSYLPEQMQYC